MKRNHEQKQVVYSTGLSLFKQLKTKKLFYAGLTGIYVNEVRKQLNPVFMSVFEKNTQTAKNINSFFEASKVQGKVITGNIVYQLDKCPKTNFFDFDLYNVLPKKQTIILIKKMYEVSEKECVCLWWNNPMWHKKEFNDYFNFLRNMINCHFRIIELIRHSYKNGITEMYIWAMRLQKK